MLNLLTKKSFVLVFLCSFVLMFLCFYVFMFFSSSQDEMAELIPKETVFYIKSDIGILRYWDIGKIFKKIPCQEFLDAKFIETEKQGMAILLNNGRFSCLAIYSIKGKDISTKVLEEFDKKSIKYLIIKNHLITSKEKAIIEKVKNLEDNLQLSLFESLPKSPRIFFGSTKSEVKAYLNLPLLKNYLVDKSDSFSQVILSLIKDIKERDWLIFRAEEKANGLVFSLSNDNYSNIFEEDFTNQAFLENSVFSKNFFTAVNVDWPEKIGKWKEIIPGFEKDIKKWEKLYNFNLQKDILPFLNEPNFFLLSGLDTNLLRKSDADPFKNIKWIFLTEKKEGDKSLEKIKEIAKQILAHKLPIEKEKVLPDGSKVKELVASPSAFEYEYRVKQSETDEIKIYFLQKPEKKFEFAYGYFENVKNTQGIKKYLPNVSSTSNIIAFSNSLEVLEKFFQDPKLNRTIENLEESNLILTEKEVFYFNLGDKKMIVKDYSGKWKVDIRGHLKIEKSQIPNYKLQTNLKFQ